MNIFDVIIGALIGMGVSLVTSLVTHWLENSRNEQARKWMIEDRQTKESSDILRIRIDEIEIVLSNLRSMAIRSADNELDLLRIMEEIPVETIAKMGFSPLDLNEVPDDLASLRNKNENKFNFLLNRLSDFFKEEKKGFPEISETITKTFESLSYVSSLNHDDLTHDVVEFINMVSARPSLSRKLHAVYYEGEKINIDEEKNTRKAFQVNVVFVHGRIINQLDTMRVTGKYEEKINGKGI